MINLDGVDDEVSIDGNFSVNTFFIVLNSLQSSATFTRYSWVFGAGGVVNTANKVPALFGVRDAVSISSSLPYQGNSQSISMVNGDDSVKANQKNFSPFADIKLVSVSSSETSLSLDNWKIGSGDAYWKGNIAEIVVFDRPLEGHQKYSIEEYLSSKWGLSSKMYRPYVPSNSLFTLDTNGTLKTATAFDYESNASSYTITVQAKDELNATTEGNFTVTLLDVYEDTDGDGFRDSLEASTGSDLNDPTSTPLQQGLVAWYPFDGNASDMSGNGNHGNVNGATLGTDRYGQANRAYSFDGVDDNLVIGEINSFEAQSHTFSTWANATQWSGDIISKDGEASQRQWLIGSAPANGEIIAHFWSDTQMYQARSRYLLSTNQWSNIVQVWNNNSLKLYIDGVLHGETQTVGSLAFGDQPIRIGGGALEGNPLWFNGSIDDIRIYDRALSTEKVKALYEFEKAN